MEHANTRTSRAAHAQAQQYWISSDQGCSLPSDLATAHLLEWLSAALPQTFQQTRAARRDDSDSRAPPEFIEEFEQLIWQIWFG